VHPQPSTTAISLGAEPRVLGWRVSPDTWGSWPADTIWHTGFTGTSMLIAPALEVAMILLTNAVRGAQAGRHPGAAQQHPPGSPCRRSVRVQPA
jgi:CubicO group peptidase (beta-lactamase class C family)